MTTSVNENHFSCQFLECVRDSYFYQHVLEPTCYRTGNVSLVFNLVLSNEEEMVTDISYLPGLGKSDHVVTAFSLACYTIQETKTCSAKKLNFFRNNYNNLRSQLSQINWKQELDGLCLLQSWTWFAEQNIKLIKNNIPVNKPNLEGKKRTPFLTRPCLEAIKWKRKSWLKYKYCKSDSNSNQYKSARNTVTSKLRTTRYQFEKKSIFQD